MTNLSHSAENFFPNVLASFYFKAKKKVGMENSFSNISVLNTLLQKVPGRVDIFHKHLYNHLTEKFDEFIKQDFLTLNSILGMDTALSIVNESYGYVDFGEFGKINRE